VFVNTVVGSKLLLGRHSTSAQRALPVNIVAIRVAIIWLFSTCIVSISILVSLISFLSLFDFDVIQYYVGYVQDASCLKS